MTKTYINISQATIQYFPRHFEMAKKKKQNKTSPGPASLTLTQHIRNKSFSSKSQNSVTTIKNVKTIKRKSKNLVLTTDIKM